MAQSKKTPYKPKKKPAKKKFFGSGSFLDAVERRKKALEAASAKKKTKRTKRKA